MESPDDHEELLEMILICRPCDDGVLLLLSNCKSKEMILLLLVRPQQE